ncbi:MAG: hypothetical protein R3C15_15650 [Thermoleophilia bacterium]
MNRRRLRPTRRLLPWLCLIAFATTAATTYRLTSPDPVAFAHPGPAAVRPPVETRHQLEQRIVDGWRCTNTARGQLGLRPYPRPTRVWRYGAILWQERCRLLTMLVDAAEREPLLAIRLVFAGPGDPDYANSHSAEEQAIRVAWCESRWTTTNRNGQYHGLFQMGESERAQYAIGAYQTALEQARSARRMFTAAGRSWARWQCRPGTGGPTSYFLGW